MRKGILMLLGVAGLVPGDWKSIDGAVLDNVAQHGFKTVQIRVDDPQSIKDKDIVRLKSMFDSRGFPMPQTVGNYGGDLIAEDEKHHPDFKLEGYQVLSSYSTLRSCIAFDNLL